MENTEKTWVAPIYQVYKEATQMDQLDSKNPKKGDAIVADYLATVRKIQLKNLNERAQHQDKMIYESYSIQ